MLEKSAAVCKQFVNRQFLFSVVCKLNFFANLQSSAGCVLNIFCNNFVICCVFCFQASPSHCDYGDGWFEVGNTCWKSFSDRKMSWYEAK